MTTPAEKLIAYIDRTIADNDKILLGGTMPAATMEIGWANYRAGVMRRRDLLAIRTQIITLLGGDDITEDEQQGDDA